jgi:probable F420-dependent oxidoreductase
MKIGAMYPQHELGAGPDSVGRFATEVERLGFDYISYPDHVVANSTDRDPPMPPFFSEHDKWQDPFSIFSYIAAITKTVKLHTGIFVLPQRPTVLTARQAADVDILSNGRLVLSVGLGWNYVEYEALGQTFRTRGRRMEEQVPLLRRLWSEHVVWFEGEFERLSGVAINPLPKRQIPIWMGGHSEPAFDRAARIADGFVFNSDFETALPRAERVLTLLGSAGRSKSEFGLELMTGWHDRARQPEQQQSIDSLRRWRDWGGTHGSISSNEHGFSHVDQHIEFQMQARSALLA